LLFESFRLRSNRLGDIPLACLKLLEKYAWEEKPQANATASESVRLASRDLA
jgi:hypothetical protein